MNSEDDHLQSTEEERRQFLLSLIPEVGEVTRSKENVEPRVKGRSIRSLTTLLESDPSDREEEHVRVRTQFEQRLKSLDELDDPLQIYLDYLDWLLEYYSQQHTQITDVLKQATDQFKQDSRYQFDPRYLKVWIAYAKRIHEPREVYLFLMQQDIGQSLALFYEAYADHEESCKKYEEAAEIYQLGLHKNAMPKKRLERNYHLFQARRREREHRGLSRPSESKRQMEALRQTGQRTMLGHKFDSRSRVSVSANVYAGIEASHMSSRSHSSMFIESPSSESNGGGFAVYREKSTERTSPISPRLHITPHASSRQENKRAVDRYTGTIIPQNISSSPTPVTRFEIYQDSDNEEVETLSRPSITSKRPRLGLQEQATDRLKRKKKERETRFMQQKDRYMKSNNSRGDTEYIMHIKFKDDMCVQEARAYHYQLIPKPIVKQDAFSRYCQENRLQKAAPEYTAETLAAMESIGQLFQQSRHNNEEEEEDLTWTNPYQHFTPIERKHVNENE